MKIYREVGKLKLITQCDAEGYVRPVYEIEVDEIVECKDCKHNKLPENAGNILCELDIELYQLNDFCSKGERKAE